MTLPEYRCRECGAEMRWTGPAGCETPSDCSACRWVWGQPTRAEREEATREVVRALVRPMDDALRRVIHEAQGEIYGRMVVWPEAREAVRAAMQALGVERLTQRPTVDIALHQVENEAHNILLERLRSKSDPDGGADRGDPEDKS